jgi:hypothetical protein
MQPPTQRVTGAFSPLVKLPMPEADRLPTFIGPRVKIRGPISPLLYTPLQRCVYLKNAEIFILDSGFNFEKSV